ncbi:hypothetical protein ACG7TL_001813 [Trametes sanguinea]
MVDNRVARATEAMTEVFVYMVLKVVAIIVLSPIFIAPALFVSLASGLCANVFIKVQLAVKRELSNAKAPVLAHFGAAVSGITSVRAYGAQEAFKAEAYRRIDRYTRVAITHWNLSRWLATRINLIAVFFVTGLATYLTYASDLSASNTGFSLTMAAAFSGIINQMIRFFNQFEISANSLERIQQYLLIEQEPKPTPEGVPPAYWPASGRLEVENLSARYSEDGPKVLHDSSLTLALLRCILTEGNVRYDGLPTEKINLDALRSSITIIPQVPELLSGTLRQNLDPFSEHDDAVLNDALRSAGLFNLQDESDQSRITLDTHIAGGGANLSVGQRQILALARAIVRRSKLLILDEATSAIDYETDSIIQTSLRTELGKDVTLVTVAHRLQTVMDYDKIMVLDAGQIVEFGRPRELLQRKQGLLRSLVDESGDMDHLYAMAMELAKQLHGTAATYRGRILAVSKSPPLLVIHNAPHDDMAKPRTTGEWLAVCAEKKGTTSGAHTNGPTSPLRNQPEGAHHTRPAGYLLVPNRARGTLRHGASAITKATRALWAHDGHASVAMYDNLAALAAGRMDALSAYKLNDLISRRPQLKLTLRWVPGHYNIPGNEAADEAAKEAAGGCSSPSPDLPRVLRKPLPLSVSKARQTFKAHLRQQAAERWRTSPRGLRMAEIDQALPSKRFDELVCSLPRRHANLLLQLRVGHIPLQVYFARIGKTASPTCPTCGEEPETVAHYLLRCPTYWLHRAVHFLPLGFTGRNLATLLNSEDAIRPLFNYVNATGHLRRLFGELADTLPTPEDPGVEDG